MRSGYAATPVTGSRFAAIVAVVTATMVGLVLLIAPAASAVPPVTLGKGYVLDQSAVLSTAQTDKVQTRMEKLKTDTKLDLWVVYVDSFTDPSSAQEWANTVAKDNGLGPSQYLLAVATGTRQFYLSGDSSGPVSDSQLTQIEQQDIQPKLAKDDWAGAAVAAADGLTAAVQGGGFGGALTWVLLVVAIIVVVVVVVVLLRRRRARIGAPANGAAAGGAATGATPQPKKLRPADVKTLEQDASAALVTTDDAIRTSEQELGFATAQFGEGSTTEFQAALTTAKANLDEAFRLKQQLDDEVPDTIEQRAEWSSRILDLCTSANDGLDEKAKEFDELRQLEQDAPGAIARTTADREAVAAEIDTAKRHLAELATTFAPEALTLVTDNVTQATQRLDFAAEQLTAAQAAVTGGDAGAAAVHIRAAEEAVGQARLLEQAIDKLGGDLESAEQHLASLIDEVLGDIAAAHALPDPDGTIAAAIVTAQLAVTDAQAEVSRSEKKRPLLALQNLEAANAQIDAVVQGARDAAAQAARAQQMLGHQILQAQAQVSAAEDYLTARRGAIGADARTRLAQAGAELVQAQQLQTTDAAQALTHAQRANQLASEALTLAQNDVGSFSPAGVPSGGGGGNMMGAVLGGILINSLLSGGSRGGFGGGFGGSGGGFSPGSFGGGGTRSRRGGGRF